MMCHAALQERIAGVPAGRWGVAVSGGADSVALLRLAMLRADLSLVVIHLDHQTRNGQSGEDAAFVAELARMRRLPLAAAVRSEVEPTLAALPRNRSARFRACRHALYRRAVAEHDLAGVLLGHHADDQAETILHRLLRGSGPAGLGGMRSVTRIGDIILRRPLLDVRAAALRAYLRTIGQSWREDASNASPDYARNRLRRLLHAHPALVEPLLELGTAMDGLRQWVRAAAPVLPARFGLGDIDGLPPILQRAALRQWLVAAGCPPDAIAPATLERLAAMLQDAATPRRAHFPGRLLVTRKGGQLHAQQEA